MPEGHQINFLSAIPEGYVDATQVLNTLRHYECRRCGALVLEISTDTHTDWHNRKG